MYLETHSYDDGGDEKGNGHAVLLKNDNERMLNVKQRNIT